MAFRRSNFDYDTDSASEEEDATYLGGDGFDTTTTQGESVFAAPSLSRTGTSYATSSFTGRPASSSPKPGDVTIPVAGSSTLQVVGQGNSVRTPPPSAPKKKQLSAGFRRPTGGEFRERGSTSRQDQERETSGGVWGFQDTSELPSYSKRSVTRDEAYEVVRLARERREQQARLDLLRREQHLQAERDRELARLVEQQLNFEHAQETANRFAAPRTIERSLLEREAEARRLEEELERRELELRHRAELLEAQEADQARLAAAKERDAQDAARRAREQEEEARHLAELEAAKARREQEEIKLLRSKERATQEFRMPPLKVIDARVPIDDIYIISIRYPNSPSPVAYNLHRTEPIAHLFDLVRFHTKHAGPIELIRRGQAKLVEQDYEDGDATVEQVLGGSKRVLLVAQLV